jgi:serine/threonine protein phosphatase PrpC
MDTSEPCQKKPRNDASGEAASGEAASGEAASGEAASGPEIIDIPDGNEQLFSKQFVRELINVMSMAYDGYSKTEDGGIIINSGDAIIMILFDGHEFRRTGIRNTDINKSPSAYVKFLKKMFSKCITSILPTCDLTTEEGHIKLNELMIDIFNQIDRESTPFQAGSTVSLIITSKLPSKKNSEIRLSSIFELGDSPCIISDSDGIKYATTDEQGHTLSNEKERGRILKHAKIQETASGFYVKYNVQGFMHLLGPTRSIGHHGSDGCVISCKPSHNIVGTLMKGTTTFALSSDFITECLSTKDGTSQQIISNTLKPEIEMANLISTVSTPEKLRLKMIDKGNSFLYNGKRCGDNALVMIISITEI